MFYLCISPVFLILLTFVVTWREVHENFFVKCMSSCWLRSITTPYYINYFCIDYSFLYFPSKHHAQYRLHDAAKIVSLLRIVKCAPGQSVPMCFVEDRVTAFIITVEHSWIHKLPENSDRICWGEVVLTLMHFLMAQVEGYQQSI